VLDCQDATTDSVPNNFTVHLGSYSGWDSGGTPQDWVLHVYSCSGADIGHVTIADDPVVSGTSTPAISSLAVLVAGQLQTWDDVSTHALSTGCGDFGGLDISTSSMLAKTRASISVSNNIRQHPSAAADIHVNQVVHVQAEGHGSPVVGGIIDGTITADGGTLFGGATDAIALVRAWDSILGGVVASDKNIAAVKIVGTASTNPGGIQGNISAANGTIDQIWTSGPIGTDSTHRSTITAGKRIGMITCRDDGGSTVQAKNFFADVEASALGVADTTTDVLSSMSLLETNGNYTGTIHLYNFEGHGQSGDSAFARVTTGRHGIFIDGDFTGDINVDFDYSHADIIARSFRASSGLGVGGSITIGKFFEGCLVAVGYDPSDSRYDSGDTLNGTMGPVSIGFTAVSSESWPNEHKPGFSGRDDQYIIDPPFEGADRGAWYTDPPYSGGYDPELLDSVIRADRSITSVSVKAMSGTLYGGDDKRGKPRIESPLIGSLLIEAFDYGAVWSGILGNNFPTTPDDINDDYASISTLTIGCEGVEPGNWVMGPAADLWVQDTPSIDLLGDVFGEIHMPQLTSSQRIRVGGKFAEHDTHASLPTSSCFGDAAYDINGVSAENSPRGYWEAVEYTSDQVDNGVAARARILLQADSSLHGQIVFNGLGASGDPMTDGYWIGDVWVGSGDPNGTTPTPVIYSTNTGRASAGRVGPSDYRAGYTVTSSTDGGGSIGVVKYYLHGTDCNPQDGATVCFMPTATWPGSGTLEVAKGALYGKMIDGVTGDGYPPVTIERQSMICSSCPAPWEDVTSSCVVLAAQGANGREVWVTYDNIIHAFPDMYYWRIRPRVSDDHVVDLRCGGTFLGTPPEIDKFEYDFTLNSQDCLELPTFAAEDPAAWAEGHGFYTIDSWDILVNVDLNRDGVLDELDTMDLLHRLGLD
jgi:hypothetical protein